MIYGVHGWHPLIKLVTWIGLTINLKKMDAHQFAESLPMVGTLIKADNGHDDFSVWGFKE